VTYNAVSMDLSALVDDLGKAGDGSRAALENLIEQVGEKIADRMRQLVPVRTGRLRGDIRVVKARMRVTVGPTTVPYAAFVEFGTGERGELTNRAYLVSHRNGQITQVVISEKAIKKAKGQRAEPYARPAAAEYLKELGPKAAQIGVDMIMGENSSVRF